jgi:CBS domain-containing membrane protein
VLIFAAPNSPLAQPWPAVMGNVISAVVAIAVCKIVADPLLAAPAAVGLAIFAMALCRATHPPGGAVALTVVIGFEKIEGLGFAYALFPTAAGTIILVMIGAIYAYWTGRRYPFRQFDEPNSHGTKDIAASERIGLTEGELTDILARYRQSLNLGVEDLARLIAAAEMQAASHRSGATLVGEIMSRDLVTVGPETSTAAVADIFLRHRFTSLPVVDDDNRFLGVIFQLHLIEAQQGTKANRGWRLAAPFRQRAEKPGTIKAKDIMQASPPSVAPESPVAAVLPYLAVAGLDAVPVLDGDRIVGIVTQTDLIAALARQSLSTP